MRDRERRQEIKKLEQNNNILIYNNYCMYMYTCTWSISLYMQYMKAMSHDLTCTILAMTTCKEI